MTRTYPTAVTTPTLPIYKNPQSRRVVDIDLSNAMMNGRLTQSQSPATPSSKYSTTAAEV